jgi:hypothetical protein
LFATLFAALFVWRRRLQRLSPSQWRAIGGLILGVAGLLLGTLPYALVGDYPSVHGWDTRHDILVGLPLAVLAVSLLSLVLPAQRRALLGFGLVGLIVIGFASAGIQDYAALQARWATDRAVMAELRQMPGARAFSVYWVKDGAPGPEDYYRFYEWSAMFADVYGGQTRIGFDTRAYGPNFLGRSEFFTDQYTLANFDPRGCQAELTIQRTGASDGEQTAMFYTVTRLFRPDRLDDYLRGLVNVQVVPISSSYATNCVR